MPIAIFLDTAVALLKRHRSLFAIIPLIALLGLSHCSDKRHTRQRDEARATVAQMEVASVAARNAQVAANLAVEASYKAKAEETDHAYQIELARARDASGRYADSHRVRAYCPGSANAAGSASQGDTAPRRDRSSDDAVVVARNDFELMVANSIRLQAVHDWGEALVKEGVALPEVELSRF